MIVAMASEIAAARDHAPTALDHNAEKSARRVGGRLPQAFDRRQIKRRPNVVNYPAKPAFSKTT
jgi:hypothetical protein